MTRRRRQHSALLSATLLLLLVGACILSLCAQQRQYVLNRHLIDALVQKDDNLALALVNEGADPNTRYTPPPVPSLRKLLKQLFQPSPPPLNSSPTALLIACGSPWNDDTAYEYEMQQHSPDAPQLVQAMLRRGAMVNIQDKDGNTPLLCAIRSHRSATIPILLNRGADVNIKNSDGATALRLAESLDTTRLLLEHGADANVKIGDWTPLIGALQDKAEPGLLTLLLKHGANINAKGMYGLPLEVACDEPNAVKLLLEWGADVNAKGNWGETALYKAIYEARSPAHDTALISSIRQLLAHGANPNLACRNGNTPLRLAQSKKRHDLVALLRQAGATK
jgi:ankyrin repeat protein